VERELEQRFMAVPDTARAESAHAILTRSLHTAGSPGDHRNAEYVLQQFRAAGLDASIEQFDVLLSEPRKVKLTMRSPVSWVGPTPEISDAGPFASTGYNAYSASGSAAGEVVFAGMGLPGDYEYLESIGVSTKGKIVLVRRGSSGSFRGVKPRVAEAHGAAGVIIYSDPDDDGYHKGDVYPKGPMRPAWGVQRGTVMYEFLYPGDPTTPDGPSTPGARHVDPAQSNLLPHIPVLPISYADAARILEHLGGRAAPPAMQYGLPVTYHVGPGPATVQLDIDMDTRVRPIWVVVARIPAARDTGAVIVLGNHRDAWTYGGVDPGTGTVAMLEMARGFGTLLRTGWRPARSIVLCNWDAEEQGMIGSTEWAEAHASELTEKGVAYVNLDVAAAGGGNPLTASAVPSLKALIREVAATVPEPTGGSVLARATRRDWQNALVSHPAALAPAGVSGDTSGLARQIAVYDLGSGTDYVSFLDHVGMASVDFGFGADEYGAYHSILDNHRYVQQFADPGFRYEVAAARFDGVLALRLAQADVLPFDYAEYAHEIDGYLTAIGVEIAARGLADRLDLRPAQAAVRALAETAERLERRNAALIATASDSIDLQAVNHALARAERGFLLPAGLSGRPFYKHAVFAPGIYSADDPVMLPGVEEALDHNDPAEAGCQLEAFTNAVQRVADTLRAVQ
jgi:N-acetylated-alpha-linked acidic dipeptidase